MKFILLFFGIAIDLVGTIWLLQGINVLPGSMMTGQIQWAIIGGLADIAGTFLIILSVRRWKTK